MSVQVLGREPKARRASKETATLQRAASGRLFPMMLCHSPSPCPPSPPNTQRWDCHQGEHRRRVLGKLHPWVSSAWGWHWLSVAFLGQRTQRPGLPAPFIHPTLADGGPATGDAGLPPPCPCQHQCAVGSGMQRGPSRQGKLLQSREMNPVVRRGFPPAAIAGPDPGVSPPRLSRDHGLVCASRLCSHWSPVKAISALAGAHQSRQDCYLPTAEPACMGMPSAWKPRWKCWQSRSCEISSNPGALAG